MLTVVTLGKMRRDHFVDGRIIKAIGSGGGVSRNTVKKQDAARSICVKGQSEPLRFWGLWADRRPAANRLVRAALRTAALPQQHPRAVRSQRSANLELSACIGGCHGARVIVIEPLAARHEMAPCRDVAVHEPSKFEDMDNPVRVLRSRLGPDAVNDAVPM